ncbi:hypothetical protein QTP88_028571 [Uroleucon formosanum]
MFNNALETVNLLMINISMLKLFGVTRLKPFTTFERENILYFFHDRSHLIKSVRNNLQCEKLFHSVSLELTKIKNRFIEYSFYW